MTAPTPEQMREIADHARLNEPDWVYAAMAALRAAANRLENQQDWLDHSHPVDIDADAKHMIDSAGEEADRLRAVIENAPHESSCAITQTGGLLKGDRYVCTCWKADALPNQPNTR